MNSQTVVLIPCYNEALTIENVIRDFDEQMPHADIYVYNNNSTDETASIVQRLQKEFESKGNPKIHLRNEYRQGKGNVIRSMFRDIEADCYIMVDGDDTYPAAFGPILEREVLEGRADMAIGDRLSGAYFTENKRRFHNFGNVLVKKLVNLFFKANLNDIMTGARAFSRDFVKSYPVKVRGFEVETDMTIFALNNNFKIQEKTIEYRDRVSGSESKLRTYSDGAKVIMTIARLIRDVKPLTFFSIIAICLALTSAAFFIPVLLDFMQTGTVEKIPTLVMVSLVMISSLLTFFCGVVLSVLKEYQRNSFEHHLTLIRQADGRDHE